MTDTATGGSPCTTAVVGAGGFLGSALCRELTERGWRVLRIERGSKDGDPLARTGPNDITWAGGAHALAEALVDAAPDVIVQLSALYLTQHVTEDVDGLLDANVRRPLHVFEAARLAEIPAIVSAGTFWEELSDDDDTPVNLYAATRCAAKTLLRFYADAYDWSAIHLRVSDLYGPSDGRGRLFSLLREAALTDRPLAMSPGEQLLDPVFVDDAANAFAIAAERCVTTPSLGFEEYGVSAGRPLNLRDLVDTYECVTGRSVPVQFGARPYRLREVMQPRFLPPVPGWRPSVPLREGIRIMESEPGGLIAGR